ncbi:zinc finger protein 91-like [Toxorhynchites rutilus septentrionalis]|uniref:zinc finger protein 91-like n=1 Tax=Toxorhynchites rutilus septentrionalis TaxID=329112 RepID=UPI002479A1A1|nr:zinc finger protein 91-like [Toxorhynchites rutilus septentrionalis]
MSVSNPDDSWSTGRNRSVPSDEPNEDAESVDEAFEIVFEEKGSKLFSCKQCRKRFRSETLCMRHRAAEHNGKIRSHLKRHNNERKLECEACGACFRRIETLNKHWLAKHGSPQIENEHINKSTGTESKKDTLSCGMCDAVFKSREGRRIHMILKHNAGKTYKCEECPMIFARKGNLRLHMTTHGVRLHVCSVCGRSYARIESLRNHEQACAEGSNGGLFCEVCGQRFRKQELLEKHKLQGHSEKEYLCNHCSQGFETKRALSHHVRVHEGTFQCEHCSLKFVTENALKNHEKSRHWEILGIERKQGRQGKRRDAMEGTKEPKVRVRRNKYNPFIGMEHLAAQSEKTGDVEKKSEGISDQSVNICTKEGTSRSTFETVPDKPETLESNLDSTFQEDDDRIPNNKPTDEKLEIENLSRLHSNLEYTITAPSKSGIEVETPGAILSHEQDNVQQRDTITISSHEVYLKETFNESESSDCTIDSVDGHRDDPDSPNDEGDGDEGSSQNALTPIEEKPKGRRKRTTSNGDKRVAEKPFPKKYRCEDCGKTFAHRPWLTSHRAKAHGIEEKDVPPPKKNRIHFCDKCNASLSDWRNLLYHLRNVHNETINEDDLTKCDTCKKRFISAEGLKGHSCVKGIYLNRKAHYKCELCGKAYYSQHGLDRHRSVHPENHKVKCDICEKPFADEKDVKYHKKRVHVDARFVCDVCGKSFKLLTQLRIHVQVHQELKRHQCEFCGKSFSQRNGMTTHLKIAHAEQLGEQAMAERELTCEICDKKLKGKVCYKLHMKTHTNERNFPCSYCDRSFVAKQDKIRHEQTHTKNYRFKCRFCDKGSTRRKLILLHEAKKHNYVSAESIGPSHKCSICGKSMSSPSALAIHESLHSDDLTVKCEQCDKMFKNVKYMKYHLNAHHLKKVGSVKGSRNRKADDLQNLQTVESVQHQDQTSERLSEGVR